MNSWHISSKAIDNSKEGFGWVERSEKPTVEVGEIVTFKERKYRVTKCQPI